MLYGRSNPYTKSTYSEFAYSAYVRYGAGMKCRSEELLADDETWRAVLEPVLCEDAAAVEVLARLLFTLKRAIDSGPEGAGRASATLASGIELIYLHTKAHRAARSLYLLSLEGDLKPQDEPLNLINAAIERARSHAR